MTTDRKALIARGILRCCGDCDFETTDRKAMRDHERSLNHQLDRSGQDEVKKLSPEAKAARSKYGRKAVKAMGL